MTSYSTDYSRFKDIVDSDEEKDSEHEAEEGALVLDEQHPPG